MKLNSLSARRGSSIHRKSDHGFSVVELLVVIVVIAILALIIVVTYNGLVKRAGISSLEQDLANGATKLKTYNAMYGTYPTSLNASNCPATPNADANFCLKFSNGNAPDSYVGTPTSFMLQATRASISTTFRISDSGVPVLVASATTPPCQAPTAISFTSGADISISGASCGDITQVKVQIYISPTATNYGDTGNWQCMRTLIGNANQPLVGSTVVVPSWQTNTLTSHSSVDCTGYLGDVQYKIYLINTYGEGTPFTINDFWE